MIDINLSCILSITCAVNYSAPSVLTVPGTGGPAFYFWTVNGMVKWLFGFVVAAVRSSVFQSLADEISAPVSFIFSGDDLGTLDYIYGFLARSLIPVDKGICVCVFLYRLLTSESKVSCTFYAILRLLL